MLARARAQRRFQRIEALAKNGEHQWHSCVVRGRGAARLRGLRATWREGAEETDTRRAARPMEPPQAHHLRQELTAAFARADDAQVLQGLHAMLRQSKQTLRDPLRIPGKNADQRKVLEEAKAKPADPIQLPGRQAERVPEPQRKLVIDAVHFSASTKPL